MRRFFKNLKLIIPQIQNSLLPALFFACAFLGYFLYGEISILARHNLHLIFWGANIVCLLILFYFNRGKPFFYVLTMIFSYLIINRLKRYYSLDYMSTPAYINLCFFAPLNLGFFYFWHFHHLLSKQTLVFLFIVVMELVTGEYLDKYHLAIAFSSSVDGLNLNSLSILLFLTTVVGMFIKCSLSGYHEDTALFFSTLNIFAGFYYSGSSTALCLFFSAAAITTVLGIIKNVHYTLWHDSLTGLASRHAYLKDSKKYPLKYSLAVICLDNYEHLLKVFGKFKTQRLLKMFANRLNELGNDNLLYRYSVDEFILIFKDCNLKQSFEKLDEIRREIAASEFMFSDRQKGIKITLSGCVSEKKRSDNNAAEVMYRAQKTLQKTYQFTQNLISKA